MEKLSVMADAVSVLLKDRRETVAVAESSAGGLVAAALVAVPGASAHFLGGGVIYTREARHALLGFSREASTMRGATEEYAILVARAIREKLGATWGLCETSASGPSGNSYGDPPGHAAFAVAGPLEKTLTMETGNDDREENMWRFAAAALDLLEAAINEGAR
jgi:PncC family amidohydrolase